MNVDELRREIVRLCRERWPGMPFSIETRQFVFADAGISWVAHVGSKRHWSITSELHNETEIETLTRLLEKVRERVSENA